MIYSEIQKRLIEINNRCVRLEKAIAMNPKAFNSKAVQSQLITTLDEMEVFIDHVKPTIELVEYVEQRVLCNGRD